MNTVPNVVMINRHALSRNSSLVAPFWQTLGLWLERITQRRALAALDDRTLQDIGLSRSTAVGEAEKPFWRA